MKSNEGRQASQGGYEGLFLYKMKMFWSVGEGSKGRKQGKESSQGRHDCLFLYLNENVFRSGRISSVYIVGCWLLLAGCHTFSKLVNFECVGMLECWCVGVL